MKLPTLFVLIIASAELMVVSYWYACGAHGLPAILHLKKECSQVVQEIGALKKEIEAIQNTLHNIAHFPLYKERIAREQLQFARDTDYLFYYNKT